MIVWIVIVGGFMLAFVLMAWRMSAGPSNEEPAIGNNLPGPSAEWGQFGLFPTLQGPQLGSPESLVDGDPEREIARELHHGEDD